jgi:ABC-2 type transport system permease protein
MLKKIISFEVSTRLKTPLFYLCCALMIIQVIILTKGIYDYYINEAVLINSSTVLYKDFAGGGMILVIVIAVITGMVLYRDIEFKTAETIYSFPINEKNFFLGKFLASFIINILITFSFILGMFLLPYSGIGKPEDFGSPPFLQMLHGYFTLMVPNIFILTASCFIPLVLTRKLSSSYLGVLFVTILFIILEGVSHTSTNIKLIEIIEPFGYVYVAEALDMVPTHLKNTTFLPFTTSFYLNRALWLSLTFIGLFWAYKRFSFAYFIQKKSTKNKNGVLNQIETDIVSTTETFIFPKVTLKHNTLEHLLKFFRLAKLEFLNLVRPKSFRIVFGIVLLLFLLQNFLFNASYYIGHEYPFTTNMTVNRLILGVFIIILIMIWTGELIFKEKTTNLWQIADTLPLPIWVRLLSKYTAMAGVALCLSFGIILTGLITQLVNGYTHFEFELYIEDILGYKWGWLNYLLLMTLPFFIAGITGKLSLTHILSIGIFIFSILAFDLGIIEDHRYSLLTGVPGIEDYSEISGYGIFSRASFWFYCLWVTLAVFFMFASIYFWQRGVKKDWLKKLSLKGEQLNLLGKIVAFGAIILFFVLQSFIANNIEGNFKTSIQQEIEQANYEKKYKKLETYPQPIIQNIDATIHLFPEDRKVDYTATFLLKNESASPIDSLYINLSDFTVIEKISSNSKPLNVLWKDKEHNIYGFALNETLSPENEIIFKIKAIKQYEGFSTVDLQEDIATNGLVLKREIFPIFGYNPKKELDENKKRKNHSLDKIASKMPNVLDTIAIKQNYFSKDAHRLTGTLKISTSKGQQIVTTGKTLKRWRTDNRNYAHFKIANPSNFEMQITSASFNSESSFLEKVNTTIWHKKSHHFNIDIYKDAIAFGLKFINTHLDGYPYKELNIAEIPYYGDAFYSSANLILISEKEGWRADTSLKKEESYIYFSVLTQLIKQKLLSKNEVANVQGAYMLTIALPQAIALQAVKEKFGKEILDSYLETKHNNYEKGRGNEPNTEPPLIYADGSNYLEPNKGVLALFSLSNDIGFKVFNEVINTYIESNKTIVFKDMYQQLVEVVLEENKESVRIGFEEVE